MTEAPRARIAIAGENDVGQRIDNYLLKVLKGVPKSRIYKALRKGEVRVNGSRKKPTYHLALGDKVRVPPIRHSEGAGEVVVPSGLLDHIPVLFEDEHILVVSKPSGLAVHGGSGMEYGLIEAMRQLRNDVNFLELVHRLDRETSGCLMLAKSRVALTGLQQQLSTDRSIDKHYLALVKGRIDQDVVEANFPLRQYRDADGMKRMEADAEGQQAASVFKVRERYQDATLVQVDLLTGRMHQARAHAVALGHPIAGDRMYGDRDFNNAMKKVGLGRLFLHAERLRIRHPINEQTQDFFAPLSSPLADFLKKMENL